MKIPLVLYAHPEKRTGAADVEGALRALLNPEAESEARAAATSAVNELAGARRRWLALFHAGTEDDAARDAALTDHAAAHIIATQMYVAHLRALNAAPHLRAATAFAWASAYPDGEEGSEGGDDGLVRSNDTAFEMGEVLVDAALWLLRLAAHAAAHWVAPTKVFYDPPFLPASSSSSDDHNNKEQEQGQQEQGQEQEQQKEHKLDVDAAVVVEEVLQCALSLLNAYAACVRHKLCPEGGAREGALPCDLGALVPALRAQIAAQLREVAVLRACASASQARPRRLAAHCRRLAARFSSTASRVTAEAAAGFAAHARAKTLLYRALAEYFCALAALEAFRQHAATRHAAVAAALLRDAEAEAAAAGPQTAALVRTVHDAAVQFRDALLASFGEDNDEEDDEEEEAEKVEEEDEDEKEDDEEGDEDKEEVGAVGMPEALDCVWTAEVVHAFRTEPVPPLLAPWRDVPSGMSDEEVQRILAPAPDPVKEEDKEEANAQENGDTPASSGGCTIC